MAKTIPILTDDVADCIRTASLLRFAEGAAQATKNAAQKEEALSNGAPKCSPQEHQMGMPPNVNASLSMIPSPKLESLKFNFEKHHNTDYVTPRKTSPHS